MDEWPTKTASGLSFLQMMSKRGVQKTPASMKTDRLRLDDIPTVEEAGLGP